MFLLIILTPIFELNVGVSLPRMGMAVAPCLAPPVLILLKSAGEARGEAAPQRALDGNSVEKLTLATVVARRKAGFPAEKAREMAGIGVAHVECNGHDALLRFAEHSSREIHPQIDVIL